MKILLDMNLSPLWIPVLAEAGIEAIHWSSVGDPGATDSTILNWAALNQYVIFTHDLDFGTLLAATQAQAFSKSAAKIFYPIPWGIWLLQRSNNLRLNWKPEP